MFPKTHIMAGAILSSLIFIIFPEIGWFNAAIIFASSVLIDFDHYLYYAVKKRDLSLKRAYNYFIRLRSCSLENKESNYKYPLLIFHGIEFCLFLLILSIFSNFFWWVFIGFVIHMLLDYLETLILGRNITFKLSQIYVLVRNKNKKDFK